MEIKKDYSLKLHNTFGLDVKAKQYLAVTSTEEIKHVLKRFYASELFILSGGSNMLLTKDLDKTVLHIQNLGKQIIEEDENKIRVRVQAGENWHQFVLWCIEQNYGGIENLSLIPGCVGTSPIQNIGAYGVELKDVFHSCKAIHIQSVNEEEFTKVDCQFGYRNSIFKNKAKGQYIITSVDFILTKRNHELKTTYGAIQEELSKVKYRGEVSIKSISDAVIAIRESKLPNPKEIGNSGSFFKNPVVDKSYLDYIQKSYPEVPFYKINDQQVKIPAGWLIEKAGFKGMRINDAGVHKKQALVLVNYGNATGAEILALAQQIQKEIQQQFKIQLEAEVNII